LALLISRSLVSLCVGQNWFGFPPPLLRWQCGSGPFGPRAAHWSGCAWASLAPIIFLVWLPPPGRWFPRPCRYSSAKAQFERNLLNATWMSLHRKAP